MPIRSLSRQTFEDEPYQVWNAYIDLLAMERYEDLTPEQRPAHLVFWYESEVQNGGHYQYFENQGVARLAETVEALGVLNAMCQQAVLREAGKLWLDRARPRPITVEDFVSISRLAEFGAHDRRFGQCSPDLQTHLANYLRDRRSWFVVIGGHEIQP